MTERVALVTGGSSGIGAATVRALRAAGVTTGVLDVVPTPSADWAAEVDVRDRLATAAAVDRALTELGRIDHLVTAAGAYRAGPIEELDVTAWRDMLALHVLGTANAWWSVLPHLLERGGGTICAIGSELALCGDPNAPHYAAAKGAIHALVKSVAVEVAPHGVRINCVAPGPTDTPLLRDDPAHESYPALLPIGRLLRPDEIAAAVCFVLLEPTNLVGQVVSPNGGAVL
jgi:NAD(P)-dependent dehydrogenase (short-subunit alcohol dehydrogenase family)